MVRPEDFGAVGDGRADDTRALQTALDRGDGASVVLSGRIYATSATLLVGSGTTLEGVGAVIRAKADDQPILASKAWASGRADTRGRTRIQGLRLEGTGRGERQDGMVLYDFWSELADLEVVNAGGRGFVLTSTDRSGTPISSTMVENRVRRCIARDCAGTAFWLGAPANGKLTDGELSDCIGMARDGATAPIVAIGHAAGWTVRNLHTYGGRPETAIEIRQAYFTRISGIYCEGFSMVGLALPALQTSVVISDVHIVAESFGPEAAFVAVSGHRDFAHPAAQFTNVVLTNLGTGAAAALANVDGRVTIGGQRLVVEGPGAGQIRAAGELPVSTAPTVSGTDAKRVVSWTGRERRVVQLATRSLSEAFADARLLTITGRSPDGGLATEFAGMAHWSRTRPDAEAVLVDLVPFGAPFGFQQQPTATFVREAERLVLTLTFTPVASGPGQLTIS